MENILVYQQLLYLVRFQQLEDLLNSLDVYYTNTSENLKYENENYSRKIDRHGIVLEEPEDIDNHLCDPARYIVQYLQQEEIIRKIA